MKKLLLSAFALAVAMSAAAFNLAPNRMQTATLSSMDNVKKAPKELVQKRLQQKFAELQKKNGLSKLDTPTKASDVVGGVGGRYYCRIRINSLSLGFAISPSITTNNI